MADITAGRLIEAYLLLREQLGDERKAFEEREKMFKTKQALIENRLLAMCDDIGSDQLKAAGIGVAFRHIETKVSTGDWNATWEWLADKRRLDMLEKRLSSKAVKDYLAEGNDLPPGMQCFNEYKITIRKA